MPAPSIGRIVHYQSYGTPGREFLPEPRAAIVTAVHHSDAAGEDDWQGVEQPPRSGDEQAAPYISSVDICVINPTGFFFHEYVDYSEAPRPGHWSWPPRVP